MQLVPDNTDVPPALPPKPFSRKVVYINVVAATIIPLKLKI